jgi:hypothetical protein
MAGMNTLNSGLLIRSEVWSNQLRDTLKDELAAQQYVEWINFPDGEVLTIPSIGDMDVSDYEEDSAIEYTPLATGEFQFSITEYVSSATYITMKNRQDAMFAARLEAMFVPKEERAIMERLEMDILDQGQPGTPNGQTASNLNLYNGEAHRWVGSATVNGARTLGFEDFAAARHALKRAKVPMRNLIAIVDPSVEFVFNTQAPTLDVTYNPQWEGIVSDSIATGMKFSRNIFGFDIYTSDYLPRFAAGETINAVASGTNAVANLFFSATPDRKPWIGAWRQMPRVDAEFNKDRQREEYVTTARYGVKLQHPENFVTVLSKDTVVVHD